MSEADAAKDFTSVLARVRAGAEIIIDDKSPAVVLRISNDWPVRRLSESLRLAKENRLKVTLDGGFEADLEAVIGSHREPLDTEWD